MQGLRTAGSITGRVLLVLFWALMTLWMIGVAEWDGRADPTDPAPVAMVLCAVTGSGGLLFRLRWLALTGLAAWVVTLVLLYS